MEGLHQVPTYYQLPPGQCEQLMYPVGNVQEVARVVRPTYPTADYSDDDDSVGEREALINHPTSNQRLLQIRDSTVMYEGGFPYQEQGIQIGYTQPSAIRDDRGDLILQTGVHERGNLQRAPAQQHHNYELPQQSTETQVPPPVEHEV